MLEVVGPFVDLYSWITSALIVNIVGGTIFLAVCETLTYHRRLKDWFSDRYRVFVDKVETARTVRELELSGTGSFVTDALLITCTLLPLAYWAGEAHAMKLLHLWG